MPTVSLLLAPADVSLFREPRPFSNGDHAVSLLPSPQTTAGAVRTWLLRGLGVPLAKLGADAKAVGIADALRARCPVGHPGRWVIDAHFHGPLLCEPPAGIALLPAPLNLARQEGQPHLRRHLPWRYAPPAIPLPNDAPAGFRASGLPAAQGWEPVEGYLSETLLSAALKPAQTLVLKSLQPERTRVAWEPRVGIGIDADRRAAEDGRLYSVSFLRLADKTVFRVDVVTDTDVRAAIEGVCAEKPWLWLGGEGRAARVTLTARAAALPDPPTQKVPERFCTYLATPALFAKGLWYPSSLLETCDLVSAVVGAPMLCSGWNRAQNTPHSPRQAVRPGAVHFWQVRDMNHPPGHDPHGSCLSDDPEDRQAGWGLCLRGE